MLLSTIRLLIIVNRRLPPSSVHPAKGQIIKCFSTGLAIFIAAFGVWNLDNIFCDLWRDLRSKMGPFGFLLQGHGELADVSVRLDPDRRTDAVPCCSHLALGHRDWCLHDHDLGNVYVSSRAPPIELDTVLLMGLVPLKICAFASKPRPSDGNFKVSTVYPLSLRVDPSVKIRSTQRSRN